MRWWAVSWKMEWRSSRPISPISSLKMVIALGTSREQLQRISILKNFQRPPLDPCDTIWWSICQRSVQWIGSNASLWVGTSQEIRLYHHWTVFSNGENQIFQVGTGSVHFNIKPMVENSIPNRQRSSWHRPKRSSQSKTALLKLKQTNS